MSLQFQQMKDAFKGANDTIKELRKLLGRSQENYSGSKDLLFGRSTETMDALFNHSKDDLPEDPLSEDADCSGGAAAENSTGTKSHGTGETPPRNPDGNKDEKSERTSRKPREKGKEARELAELPNCTTYQFDSARLDEEYGKGNWRVCYWHKHVVIDVIPARVYQKTVYSPVIALKDRCGELITVPYESACLPGAKPSAALLSMLANDKFAMFLPLYRQEHDPGRFGFTLRRQRMCRWLEKTALELYQPVYKDLLALLLKRQYIQIDETTYLVISDGREGVHKSYIWVHRTSELSSDQPEIIFYSYEPTRSAQHLRDLFAQLRDQVTITCDAYSAYFTIASELLGLVHISGCLAHCRRRFVKAFMLLDPSGLSKDDLLELDEVKAIEKIAAIYAADGELKKLSAEDRLQKRQTEVKPLVDDFFAFVHSCDVNNPLYSDKMKDALCYARNQEEYLRQFLNDACIPVDNSKAEQSVKPVAIGRKNYLFSYSVDGAKSNCIIQTLIETAEANHADPRIYLEYVAYNMSQSVYYGHDVNIEDMRPWSSAYREYEQQEKIKRATWVFPEDEECPTPVKPKDLRDIVKTPDPPSKAA